MSSCILKLSMKKEVRKAFVESRQRKIIYDETSFNEMKSYILGDDCVRDLERLIAGDYFFPPPVHFRVQKDFSDKKRDVYTWRDTTKYLMSLICFAMRSCDHIYSDGLYSFRVKKSSKDFLLKLKNVPDLTDYYIVKADISNYVGSIVPELILPILKNIWKDDPSLYELMEFLLLRRECVEKDGTIVSCEPGGMGGVPLSNHFMNVYLMEMDEYFEGRVPFYCRYSDDIIIFEKNREEAEAHISYFRNFISEKKLVTNSEKTRLIEPKEAVDILGFKLKAGKIDITDHAKKKLKQKIRLHANKLIRLKKEKGISSDEAGKMMIEHCNKKFFGQLKNIELTWAKWVFPVITETASLRELDDYIQNAIRYVMSGTLTNKRYNIRYKKLKELGYRSLVHAYYHFEGV